MDKYDWITTVFSDWAFTFVTSFLYYQDYDRWRKQNGMYTEKEWNVLAALHRLTT